MHEKLKSNNPFMLHVLTTGLRLKVSKQNVVHNEFLISQLNPLYSSQRSF